MLCAGATLRYQGWHSLITHLFVSWITRGLFIPLSCLIKQERRKKMKSDTKEFFEFLIEHWADLVSGNPNQEIRDKAHNLIPESFYGNWGPDEEDRQTATAYGFSIRPGEWDSYGWLTACIYRAGRPIEEYFFFG